MIGQRFWCDLGSALPTGSEKPLTRCAVRRFPKRPGFYRKLENHATAVALNYFAYNFIKIDRRLRMTPAMAAGVTDRIWDVNDLVVLWEAYERRAERVAV